MPGQTEIQNSRPSKSPVTETVSKTKLLEQTISESFKYLTVQKILGKKVQNINLCKSKYLSLFTHIVVTLSNRIPLLTTITRITLLTVKLCITKFLSVQKQNSKKHNSLKLEASGTLTTLIFLLLLCVGRVQD